MLCDFDWPYEGRDVNRNEVKELRKELDELTARCCRFAKSMENNKIPLRGDQQWWDKHKKYDNKK
jgi:hypothetical protein